MHTARTEREEPLRNTALHVTDEQHATAGDVRLCVRGKNVAQVGGRVLAQGSRIMVLFALASKASGQVAIEPDSGHSVSCGHTSRAASMAWPTVTTVPTGNVIPELFPLPGLRTITMVTDSQGKGKCAPPRLGGSQT